MKFKLATTIMLVFTSISLVQNKTNSMEDKNNQSSDEDELFVQKKPPLKIEDKKEKTANKRRASSSPQKVSPSETQNSDKQDRRKSPRKSIKNLGFQPSKLEFTDSEEELKKELKVQVHFEDPKEKTITPNIQKKPQCRTQISNRIKAAINAVKVKNSGIKASIKVGMYSLTDTILIGWLNKAAENGIKVSLILDKEQNAKNNKIKELKNVSINFMSGSGKNGSYHEKFSVITCEPNSDKVKDISSASINCENVPSVVVGSYNWSKAASEDNYENCLVISEGDIVTQFSDRFDKLDQLNK